jgi:hypothetical protein
MIYDAIRGGIVNAGKRTQVFGRRAVDVDGALLLDTFHHTLNHRFRIASGGRGCAGRLLANFIGAAIMRCAAGENDGNRQYQGRNLHQYLDAGEPVCGKLSSGLLQVASCTHPDSVALTPMHFEPARCANRNRRSLTPFGMTASPMGSVPILHDRIYVFIREPFQSSLMICRNNAGSNSSRPVMPCRWLTDTHGNQVRWEPRPLRPGPSPQFSCCHPGPSRS